MCHGCLEEEMEWGREGGKEVKIGRTPTRFIYQIILKEMIPFFLNFNFLYECCEQYSCVVPREAKRDTDGCKLPCRC